MQLVKNTSTGKTIQVLCRSVATHGVPDTIVSDNDSCFTSRAFKDFATANGIKHKTTAFYHPSSNGIAEGAVRTYKEYLRKPSTLSLLIRISKFLLTYRLTTHTVTGEELCKLMFGKIIHSNLYLV